MIIIETTSVILPRFKRVLREDLRGGESRYICFAMFGVMVTLVRDGKLFREAVRRYAQDDWSEHEQVRLAAKKARSKARVQERGGVKREMRDLQYQLDEAREERYEAKQKEIAACKKVEAMKIAFKEVKGFDYE